MPDAKKQVGNSQQNCQRDHRVQTSIRKTKLERIAWLSSKDPQKEYSCLMHLYNEESLTECFHGLDGKKAVGLDGITKTRYGEDLTDNIGDLIKRMKKMAYRPE